MAKSSKPTNAFGFDPNSFKAVPNKSVEEKQIPKPVIPEETPAPVEEVLQPTMERTQTKRKRDPQRERKTCHIHFLMQESLLARVDAYAAKVDKSRAAVIEKALKAYLLEHDE